MERLPDHSFLHPVLDTARRVDGAVAAYVQQYDPHSRELRIVAHRGLDEAFLSHFRVVRAGDGSAGGQVLSDRRRIVIVDTHTDVAYAPHVAVADAAGIRAVLAFPLVAADTFMGAMATHYGQPHQPTALGLGRLDRLACVAALVLYCADMRGESKARADTPDLVPKLPSKAVHAALVSRELLAQIAERPGNDAMVETTIHQLDLLVAELRKLRQKRSQEGPR